VLHLIREEYRANIGIGDGLTSEVPVEDPKILGRISEEIDRSGSPLDDDLSFTAFKQQSGAFLANSNTSGSSIGGASNLGRSMIDSSMYNLLADNSEEVDYSKPLFALKQLVIHGLNELIDELETVESNIASQALEYIHNK
jgi:hypothetical protein